MLVATYVRLVPKRTFRGIYIAIAGKAPEQPSKGRLVFEGQCIQRWIRNYPQLGVVHGDIFVSTPAVIAVGLLDRQGAGGLATHRTFTNGD
jgi:hypothetical protein